MVFQHPVLSPHLSVFEHLAFGLRARNVEGTEVVRRVTAIAEDHRQHISRRFYDCSPELHASLADMYVADERFAAHYERRAAGLAQYVHDAVKANADASR